MTVGKHAAVVSSKFLQVLLSFYLPAQAYGKAFYWGG